MSTSQQPQQAQSQQAQPQQAQPQQAQAGPTTAKPTPEVAIRQARRSLDEQLSTLQSSQAESIAAEQRLVELQADVGRATQQRDQNLQQTRQRVVELHAACDKSIAAIEVLKANYPLPVAG